MQHVSAVIIFTFTAFSHNYVFRVLTQVTPIRIINMTDRRGGEENRGTVREVKRR